MSDLLWMIVLACGCGGLLMVHLMDNYPDDREVQANASTTVWALMLIEGVAFLMLCFQ